MPNRTVKILIEDGKLDETDKICKDLKEVGLDIDFVFHKIGLVFGEISSKKVYKLKKIEGVQAIDGERIMKALPEKEKIQTKKQKRDKGDEV